MLETLRQTSVIQSAESSNRIEGIVAPTGRVRRLVEEKTTPRDRSEQEIAGYRDVLNAIHASYASIPFTLTFLEPTAVEAGAKERRVLFEDGLDVDFVILSAELVQRALDSGLPPLIAAIFRRGVRVLLDRDGTLTKLALAPAEFPRPCPPNETEFLELVNDFLYHAVWTAKKLRRGELWTAKSCSDVYMKRKLLNLMEWNARALNGWDYDIWHNGRFLEHWANPQALSELPHVFAHYDRDEVSRALLATMNLFRWLAIETAEKLGYAYPVDAHDRITDWVRDRLEGQ